MVNDGTRHLHQSKNPIGSDSIRVQAPLGGLGVALQHLQQRIATVLFGAAARSRTLWILIIIKEKKDRTANSH